MGGCEDGNVFDSFTVVLRRRSRGKVVIVQQREKSDVSVGKLSSRGLLVADGRSDTVVPLRSERGSDAHCI